MKKNTIRVAFTVLFLGLFFIAAGCGQLTSNQAVSSDKVSIVSTIFAPYDFTRQIAGDHVDLAMLLPPAAESHSFEPTPRDIIRIQNCDIFIYVGGESDAWVRNIMDSVDTSNMKLIEMMDCVETVDEEIVEGMEHEEEEEAAPDEHVWTSPRNAKHIVQKISDTLCEVDPQNATVYQQNTVSYLESLDRLDASFQSVVDAAKRKTLIFGDRFPFRYFADVYGLDYFAAFPGCSTETEASAATVAFLIDKIKEEGIPVVFHAELSNQKMADTISDATGAKVLLLHACHNISKTDFESGIGYLELMNRNVGNLKEALL